MSDVPLAKIHAAIENQVREAWGHTLAALVHRVRDFQLAEDCLQEAILTATQSWPKHGIPGNPGGWLFRVALRRAIDEIRRRENFEAKRSQLEQYEQFCRDAPDNEATAEIPDERLRLIFTCCHPALDSAGSVALTLRAVGGLTTGAIARAFLVEEPAMAQRLVRAKRKIREAGIPYRIPPREEWTERVEAVLSVLYLIFNEGYQVRTGSGLLRRDLCEEAIHLARVFVQLTSETPEAEGLLALMLAHHARHRARANATDTFIPLEAQNRDLWNRAEIAEADAILTTALDRKTIGPYQIQAAISILHGKAASWKSTDWLQIDLLYGALHRLQPTPVVRLNQLIARSMHAGPDAVWAEIEALDAPLSSYQPYHAARADLLSRRKQPTAARAAYDEAIALSANEAERHYLQRQRDRLSTAPKGKNEKK